MPATYNHLAIRFQYPENWTLEADETSPGRQAVSVYSPGGAMWSAAAYPRHEDLKALADAALQAMRSEYQDLDSEPVLETTGEAQLEGYDLNFYCLDLTSTACVRAFRTSSSAYLVICQAEDREFEQIAPVFKAMTASLLSED